MYTNTEENVKQTKKMSVFIVSKCGMMVLPGLLISYYVKHFKQHSCFKVQKKRRFSPHKIGDSHIKENTKHLEKKSFKMKMNTPTNKIVLLARTA